jgi:protein arginine N-methyltransferase 5
MRASLPQDALLCGFDFVVAPLVRPDYRPPLPGPSTNGQLTPPFQREQVLYLSSSERVSQVRESRPPPCKTSPARRCCMHACMRGPTAFPPLAQVVGAVSTWIDPDSDDATLKAQSVATLKQELAWAAHLGLQAVLLPPAPHTLRTSHYSQVVQQALSGLSHMAVWMTVPIAADPAAASLEALEPEPAAAAAAGPRPSDPWETWNQFRQGTDFHNLLGCVLELGAAVPPPRLQQRWFGEPVKALLLPTHVFSTNKRGYPVLSKAHQELLANFFRMNVQVCKALEKGV